MSLYWYCEPCYRARWPQGREQKTPGRIIGPTPCAQCGKPVGPREEMACVTDRPLPTTQAVHAAKPPQTIAEAVLADRSLQFAHLGDVEPSALAAAMCGPSGDWKPITMDDLKRSVAEMSEADALRDKVSRFVGQLTMGIAAELDRMCREAIAAHPGVALHVVNMDHKAYWIATQEKPGVRPSVMVSDVIVVDYADPRGFRMRAKL